MIVCCKSCALGGTATVAAALLPVEVAPRAPAPPVASLPTANEPRITAASVTAPSGSSQRLREGGLGGVGVSGGMAP